MVTIYYEVFTERSWRYHTFVKLLARLRGARVNAWRHGSERGSVVASNFREPSFAYSTNIKGRNATFVYAPCSIFISKVLLWSQKLHCILPRTVVRVLWEHEWKWELLQLLHCGRCQTAHVGEWGAIAEAGQAKLLVVSYSFSFQLVVVWSQKAKLKEYLAILVDSQKNTA